MVDSFEKSIERQNKKEERRRGEERERAANTKKLAVFLLF